MTRHQFNVSVEIVFFSQTTFNIPLFDFFSTKKGMLIDFVKPKKKVYFLNYRTSIIVDFLLRKEQNSTFAKLETP